MIRLVVDSWPGTKLTLQNSSFVLTISLSIYFCVVEVSNKVNLGNLLKIFVMRCNLSSDSKNYLKSFTATARNGSAGAGHDLAHDSDGNSLAVQLDVVKICKFPY